MPEFWQFPTVSMGLGPLGAIYQAKFLKYPNTAVLKDTFEQTVYASPATARWMSGTAKAPSPSPPVKNWTTSGSSSTANLQRLDGPVTGNGKIINELEGIFAGAGWNVIKVIWGGRWDELLRKDTSGKLIQLMEETVDGDYQTLNPKTALMCASISSATSGNRCPGR